MKYFFCLIVLGLFVGQGCQPKVVSRLKKDSLEHRTALKTDSGSLGLLVPLQADSLTLTLQKSGLDKLLYQQMVDSFIQKNTLQYKYFTAELNVSYKDTNYGLDFLVMLRMQKDSIIWLSVETFGLELYRVLIDTRQMILLDRLANKYRIIHTKDMEKLVGFKADLTLLQQILAGQFVQARDTLATYQRTKDTLRYLRQYDLYQNMIEYLISSSRINKEVFTFKDDLNVPTLCTLYYDRYLTLDKNLSFAHRRQIDIQGKMNMSLILDYKKVKIDQKPLFPFTIPKHFSLAS